MEPLVVRLLPPGPPLPELAAAVPTERWPWLLDSGPGALGRWHLLALDPAETLELQVGEGPVADPAARALGRLEALLDRRWPGRHGTGAGAPPRSGDSARGAPMGRDDEGRAPDGGPLPPFRGGALALLAYDLGRQLERLPARVPRDAALPDLLAGIYPFVVAEEVASGRRLLVGRGPPEEAAARVAELSRLALAARPLPPPAPAGRASSSFGRQAYLEAVEAAREHIRDGDVYQVNLSQRFSVPWSGDPAALQAALRQRSPVPYGALLRTPRLSLVGNSPELFLSRRGTSLVSRPIKGTRPRGGDPAEDARLRAALEASPKEHAELAMIVDLVRNDLGRSARVGSVEVGLPFVTEAWATVFHRVAEVRCRLAPGTRAAPVVEAAFPPASVTGTPKIRALEVIEELEPVRRHAYTGALGWFDAAGDFDLSVSIRIATLVEGRLLVPVGGGITLDSDPAAEYEETLHKARAFLEVLRLPHPGTTVPA